MKTRYLALHAVIYFSASFLLQGCGWFEEEEEDDFRYCYDSEVICDLFTSCVSFEMIEEEANIGTCEPGNEDHPFLEGKSPFPVPILDEEHPLFPQQVGGCHCARLEVFERWPEKCRYLDWCADDAPLMVNCRKEIEAVQRAPYCYNGTGNATNATNQTNDTDDARRLERKEKAKDL
jgi:hypothetical protein